MVNKCVTRKCKNIALKGFRKCMSCINPTCKCGKRINRKNTMCYECEVEAKERTIERSEEE